VKDPYNENCKSLKKEIEEDMKRWKDLPWLWMCRISIMKMAILCVQCTSHQNSSDIPHRV
jgi:hypothetical protein